jgi:hypothetical protein
MAETQDFPHPPLAAGRLAQRLLNRHSPHEIAEAIEVLVDVLDLIGGDPDQETDDPDLEPSGDEKDAAYVEWTTKPSNLRRQSELLLGHEDDEEDDEDCCTAADDDPARRITDGLPGDSYDTELNGDEGDYSGDEGR